MMPFDEWIDTFLSEKGVDMDHIFAVETKKNTHYVDLRVLIENLKVSGPTIQNKVKTTLIQIDFRNGDVMHYLRFLAEGLCQASDQ